MRPSPTALGAVKAALRRKVTPRPSTASLPSLARFTNPRLFSTTQSNAASSSSSSKPSSSKSSDPPAPKGPIRDEHILKTSPYVRLVDPKSGSLAGPFDTKQILSKLDRTKFFLQQVAPAQPSRATLHFDPSSPPSDPSLLVQFAICKLIDKKEEFDRVRNAKRKLTGSEAPTTATGSKEVQLTWSVSANDLAHKFSKAKKELLKGSRINVIITTKAGGRRYIKGFDVKEDERRERLLQDVERFLCVKEGEAGEEETVARRLQDIEWQKGGSAAVMSFECFRK